MKSVRLLSFLLILCWFLGGLLLIALFLLFWSNAYSNATVLILHLVGGKYPLAAFRTNYLPPSRFEMLRYLAVLMVLAYGFLSVFILKRTSVWAEKCIRTFSMFVFWIKRQWQEFPKTYRITAMVFAVIICILNIYRALTVPVFYDEAWTYLNFTSRSVLVTLGHYPAPNNHIFFTLLTNITALLPLPATFALRLPNLLLLPAAFFTWLLLLRRWFSPERSLVGAVLLAVSYPVQLYSLQARGYLLYILLASVAFCIVHTWATRQMQRWIMIVVCVMGLYTMPSFLYVVFSCGMYLCIVAVAHKNWKYLPNGLITVFWTGTLTLLLYLPVLLLNGWRALADNPYVKRYSLQEVLAMLPMHFMNTGNWLLGTFAYGYICIIALLLGICVYMLDGNATQKSLSLLSLVFLLCPFLIAVVHRTVPFERTWSYCVFPLVVGLLLQAHSLRIFTVKSGFIMTALASVLSLGVFPLVYRQNYAGDYRGKQLADGILKSKAKCFYVERDYDEVLLYYYFTAAKRPYKANRNTKIPIRDSGYDCLVVTNPALVDNTQYRHASELPPHVFFNRELSLSILK